MSRTESQSQVDSILKKLQAVLKESNVNVNLEAKEELPQDTKAASLALKDFLNKNSNCVKAEVQALDDPKLVVERRTAVSAFIGVALTNNGVAVLPGIINQDNCVHAKAPSHGKGNDSHKKSSNAKKAPEPAEKAPLPPLAPAPTIVMTVCPACVQAEAVAKAAAADKAAGIEPVVALEKTAPQTAQKSIEEKPLSEKSNTQAAELKQPEQAELAKNSKPPSMDMGMSMSSSLSASSYSFSKPYTPNPAPSEATDHPAAEQAQAAKSVDPTSKASSQPASKPKSVVASLFSAFGGSKKGEAPDATPAARNTSAPSAVPAESSSANTLPHAAKNPASSQASIIWFKHFQTVESALRIGDTHFAESVVSVLHEASISLSAEQHIVLRIESFRARILMDRKQHTVAEKSLTDILEGLKGSQWESNVAAAYCWHALAQCQKQQNQMEKAAESHNKAIMIAEAALGSEDPETMLFKAPL